MKRIVLMGLLLGSGLLHAQQPNILFFFVDDLGYGDIGCFWQDDKSGTQKFDTPHLDSMAAEGAKLTHHYISASVCAPSRASLMQGRHQGHCDIRNSQFDNPLPENHTVSDMLQRAGYRTIHVGKGGLSGGEGSTNLTGTGSQNLAAHPLDRGFDEFFGYLFHADGHEHYPSNGTTNKGAHIYDGYRQVNDASLDLYTTDAWTAYAKNAITTEVQDGDSQPFFLYLAYDTPHFKMQRPAVAYPAGGGLTGGIQWTTATDGSGNVRYASTADGTGAVDAYTHPDIDGSWSASNQQHVGMIRRIDNSIGDILQLLDDLNIADNTLVIFSSDNGPHNEGNDPRFFESFADMEGIKRDMWEAGIRVPTIVRWPGQIAGATDDENNIHEIDQPSAIWDWMPTFADMADVPAPAWCDGVSILPTLTGAGTQRDKGYLYFEFNAGGSTPGWTEFPNHGGDAKGQMQCLRIGDYMGVRTAISSANDDFRIYDVTTDPGQAADLAGTLGLQQQMKDLALQARRPFASAARPYDGTPVPALVTPVEPGLEYASYEGAWSYVPEFRDMTAAASGDVAGIDLTARSRENDVGLLFTGYVQVPSAGSYTFSLTSDDGANLFLHDAHVIDDDFNHDGSERSGTIQLEAGLHPIRIYYRHSNVQAHQLELQWQGPSISKQAVPAGAFFRDGVPPPEPQANDDTATTTSPNAVNIAVLANDFDDGQPSPLGIDSFTQPANGTVTQLGDELRYTPNPTFEGTDTFTYTVTDGQFTDTANVNVTVLEPNLDGAARWDLEEGAGTTTTTTGGIESDTFGTGVIWSTDTPGPASSASLSFPGTAVGNFGTNLDALAVGINGTGAKTITGWIKTSADFYGMFFGWSPNGSGGAGRDLRLGLQNGSLRLEVSSGFSLYDTVTLNDGEWHMVGAVIEPDDNVNSVQFYIDGSLVEPTSAGDRLINTDPTGPAPREEIGLGIGTLGGILYWSGLLDDVRVFDSALDLTTLDAVRAEMFTAPPPVIWGGAGSQGAPAFWNSAVNGSSGRNDDPTHWNQATPPDMGGVDDAVVNGGGIQKNGGHIFSNGSSMTLNSGAFFRLNDTEVDGFTIESGGSLIINDGIFDSNTRFVTIAGADTVMEVVNGSFVFDAQTAFGFGINGGATVIVRSGGTIETSTFFNSQNVAVAVGGSFVIDGGTLWTSGAEANPIRAASGLDGGGYDFTGLGGTIQIDNFTGGDLTTYLQGRATSGFFKVDGTTVSGFGATHAVDDRYLDLTTNGTSGSLVLASLAGDYTTWISGFDVGGQTELADNPDRGRLPNGIEFLLGGNPAVANDTALPMVTVDANDLVLTFDRDDQAIESLEVVVQVSSDLASWPLGDNIPIGIDTTSSGPGVTITDEGATDAVEVRIPRTSDAKKFIRIRVRPPVS